MVRTNIYFIAFRLLACTLIIGTTQICSSQPDGIFIKDDGKVGIGTLVPASKLDVRGSTPDDGVIFTLGNSDQTHQLKLFGGKDSDPNPFILWESGDPLRFATTDGLFSEKMRISPYGSVGIGVQNPSAKMHVFGDGLFRGAESGLGIYPGSDYSIISFKTQTGSYSNMVLRWAKTYFNGNVGIGTSDPQAKLHVDDRIRIGRDPTYGALYGELIHEGGNSGFRINSNAGGTWADMYFQTNGVTRMFLESAGKFGIGTESPLSKLHIEGGVDASNTTHGYFMTGPVTSTNIIMDNNEIMARNNGEASYLYINHNGGTVHMGPGSPADGYQLSVRGKIMSEELRIDNYVDWPDYVFEKNYSLLPLEELRFSIQESGHLPGFPSASEVNETGIDVGEMQKKLLEKIEELTLYIFQLHEENKLLKQDIEVLKAEVQPSVQTGKNSHNN